MVPDPNLTAKKKELETGRPLEYGQSVVNCRGFQVVAFAHDIVGEPTGDLTRFPKLLSIVGAGKASIQGIDDMRLDAYAKRFFEDRAVMNALREMVPELEARILQKEKGKVGLRNLVLQGDGTIRCDIERVPFTAYDFLARRGITASEFNACGVTGVCMMLVTTDNKLVVQVRGAGNRSYGRIPGASIAGLLDAEIDQTGAQKWLTRESLRARIDAEGREEIGQNRGDLHRVEMVGVVFDSYKPHHEISLVGRSTLDSKALVKQAEENFRKAAGVDLPFDFAERAVCVPFDLQTIEKLISEIRTPLPPTHSASLLCIGYQMVKSENGEAAAIRWAGRMEQQCAVYYTGLDSAVAAFYSADPKRFFEVPGRYEKQFESFAGKPDIILPTAEQIARMIPPSLDERGITDRDRLVLAAMLSGVLPDRSPSAYSPGYFPEEQGLGKVERELAHLVG